MAESFLATDSRISRNSRISESGGGLRSAWVSAQYRMKISNTLNFKAVCDVIDPDGTFYTNATINIDNGDAVSAELTSAAEIYTGEKDHTFAIANTNEHTIIIKIYGIPIDDYWDGFDVAQMILKSIELDTGGVLTAWDQDNLIRLATEGDSWMGVTTDYPHLMDQTKYNIYSLSHSAKTADVMAARIAYMSDGILETTEDPHIDFIICNSSVNDYNRGDSLATFNTNFASLIDNTQATFPNIPILCPQSPDNTGAGKTFSQYGPEMLDVSSTRAGVYYLPVDDLGAITWLPDTLHLTFASRQTYADYVAAGIEALFYFVETAAGKKLVLEKYRLDDPPVGSIAKVWDGTNQHAFKMVGGVPTLTDNFTGIAGYVSGG